MVTKIDNKSFKNSTKCWIYDNTYVDCDVKQIIVISLENMESLHIETIMSTFIEIIKLKPKNLWFQSCYAKSRQILK